MTETGEKIRREYQRRVAANWPVSLPREPFYPAGKVPLTAYAKHWAATKPDAPALHYYGRAISWRRLDELSDRLGALLARNGINPGDRVALCLPNCPQYTIAFLGILKAGAIVVPVNPLVKAIEFAHYLHDSGAKALIVLDRLHEIALAAGPPALTWVTGLKDFLPEVPAFAIPPGTDAPRVVPEGTQDLLPAQAAQAYEVTHTDAEWRKILTPRNTKFCASKAPNPHFPARC